MSSLKQIFLDAYREAKIETETKRHLQKGLKLNPKFSYTIIARDEKGKIVGQTKKIAGLNTDNYGNILAALMNSGVSGPGVNTQGNASTTVYFRTSSPNFQSQHSLLRLHHRLVQWGS